MRSSISGCVPRFALGKPIISDHIRSDLIRRKLFKANGRHFRHAKELRCLHSAVTGDDRARLIDQDWIDEPETLDAVA